MMSKETTRNRNIWILAVIAGLAAAAFTATNSANFFVILFAGIVVTIACMLLLLVLWPEAKLETIAPVVPEVAPPPTVAKATPIVNEAEIVTKAPVASVAVSAPDISENIGGYGMVKATEALPGQAELSERKGTWRYEDGASESQLLMPCEAESSEDETTTTPHAETVTALEAGAADPAPDASTNSGDYGMVKSTGVLPGQVELSERKGTWQYKGTAAFA